MTILRLENSAVLSEELFKAKSLQIDAYLPADNKPYSVDEEIVASLELEPSMIISDKVSYAYFLLSEALAHNEEKIKEIDSFFEKIEPDPDRRFGIQNDRIFFCLNKNEVSHLKNFLATALKEYSG